MFFLFAVLFNPISELEQVREALNREMPGHEWHCSEIGNGNINFIYLADAKDLKVIVKKDLGFARINPEAFPLPLDRLLYEYRAYTFYEKWAPQFVPKIYFFDQEQGMLAMEYLFPHVVLTAGLIQGEKYPMIGRDLGLFLAKTLYHTSKYSLSQEELEKNISLFADNHAMRKIILDLNYTDPFYGSPLNWWTSPELDDLVEEIQSNAEIRATMDHLKERFLFCPEALAHGDLHTGSILVTANDTKVIDSEFATYAPISFDIGMLLANFAMAAMAADAHGADRAWLAKVTREIWDVFEVNFPEKDPFIWEETLKLMGMEIVRRTIGLAHSAYFEKIGNRALKVGVERKALELAKELLLGADIPDSESLEKRLL